MIYVWIFPLLGLAMGSFIAAFTYRLPRGKSIIHGRSSCDQCGRKIRLVDNIPILSYLLLGGKCHFCGKKISLRYPLIELSTGTLFLVVAFFFRDSAFLELIFNLFLVCLSLTVLIIDWEKQMILDVTTFGGLFLVLIYFILTDNPAFYQHLFSGFVAALTFLSINLLTRGRGMGLGDSKLALLIGTILGPARTPLWFFLAFLIGGVFSFFFLFWGRFGIKDKIAFGPFMVFSFLLSLFFGQQILALLYVF